MKIDIENAAGKVITSLIESGFLFSAADFTLEKRQSDLQSTNGLVDRCNSWFKIAKSIALPVMENSIGGNFLTNRFKLSNKFELNFDTKGFQRSLNEIQSYVDFVCFKYVLSQPIIAAVLFADKLSKDEEKLVFEQFDKAILSCRQFTSSFRAGLGKVKMTVVGIIIWCFADESAAQTFLVESKKALNRYHFFQKVCTGSWCVDLPNSTLYKDRGGPVNFSATSFRI